MLDTRSTYRNKLHSYILATNLKCDFKILLKHLLLKDFTGVLNKGSTIPYSCGLSEN